MPKRTLSYRVEGVWRASHWDWALHPRVASCDPLRGLPSKAVSKQPSPRLAVFSRKLNSGWLGINGAAVLRLQGLWLQMLSEEATQGASQRDLVKTSAVQLGASNGLGGYEDP